LAPEIVPGPQLTNAPKDVFRLPGVHNWDTSFVKNFPFSSEKSKLQLRWEIDNTFNQTQFTAADNAAQIDAAGAQVNTCLGQAMAACLPRVTQGSLRLTFETACDGISQTRWHPAPHSLIHRFRGVQ